MSDFFNPIIRLHKRGLHPKGILDIGAHHGFFAGNLHKVWPNAKKLLFEANPDLEPHLVKLGLPYRICLLGSKEDSVTYYVDRDNAISTGNSIYLEQSHHFKDPIKKVLPMHRLDDVIDDRTAYDFMKIDVQGAELEVLAGAPETLKSVKFLFLEVSLYETNQNAPLFYQVHSTVAALGYRMIDLSELTVVNEKLLQFNALFERA